MKIQLAATTKIFIIVVSVSAFLVILMANSKKNSVVVNASDGASVYAMSCARCHGADGRAKTAKGKQTGAVDLTSDEWEPNDARDTRIITNGKGKMPAFKRTLKPEQIKSVVVYIRRFKG